MTTAATSKICRRCNEEKSSADYYANKNTADKLSTYCKPCISVQRREYYIANRDEKLRKRAEYRANHPGRVAAAKRASYEKYKPDNLSRRATYVKTPAGRLSLSLDGYKKRRAAYGLEVLYIPFTVDEFLSCNEWGVCSNCGDTGEIELDHIIPVCREDSEHSVANLRLLCFGCHRFQPRVRRTTNEQSAY